jgi:hypothetical protein
VRLGTLINRRVSSLAKEDFDETFNRFYDCNFDVCSRRAINTSRGTNRRRTHEDNRHRGASGVVHHRHGERHLHLRKYHHHLERDCSAPNGAATEEPLTVVSIERSTLSTFEVLLSGAGQTTDFVFTVDKDLKNANLQASLRFDDDNSQTSFPLTVNMNWVGTRPLNDHSHSNTRDFDGLRIIENFKGRHRQAIATGSVEGLGIEFTPVASSTAEIQINRSGTLTIEIN